jgi:hypothetical protein
VEGVERHDPEQQGRRPSREKLQPLRKRCRKTSGSAFLVHLSLLQIIGIQSEHKFPLSYRETLQKNCLYCSNLISISSTGWVTPQKLSIRL